MPMNSNMMQNNNLILNPMILNQNMNNLFLLNQNMNNQIMFGQNMNNQLLMDQNMNNPMMMNQNMNNPMMKNQNMNNPMMMNQNMNNPMMMNQNMNNPMMMNQKMMNQNMNNQFQNNIMNNNQILNNQGNKQINFWGNDKVLNLINSDKQLVLDNKRKNLINCIIKFYKNNGLKNMDYHQMSQIKLLNKHLGPDFKGFRLIDRENEFSYIKDNKKLIYFISSGFNIIKTRIPNLITKSELYSIAKLFKDLSRTNILLIYSEKILENNESSIEEISEGGNIIIIEDRYYQDDEYFITTKEKNIRNNDKKMNIILKDETKVFVNEIIKDISLFELGNIGKFWTRFLILSPDLCFSELLEQIYLIYGSNPKDLRVIGNDGTFINFDNHKKNMKIGDFLRDGDLISIYNSEIPILGCDILGKELIAKAGNNIQIKVGRLNSTNVLFCIDHGFKYFKKKLKSVTIKNKIIKCDEDNSFYSLGLNDNFECILD